jgi:hypothetical protein
MTKISIYNKDTDVRGNDKWIGSDAQNQNRTKNFTPDNVAAYFNENQVIDLGVDLRYFYDTLDPLQQRVFGSITFETEIGPQVNFSAISTFILSKYTMGHTDVSQFLDFLIGSNVLLSRANNINMFGYYKIDNIEPYLPDPNFFVVTLTFETGNGYMKEDEDYFISLVQFEQTIPEVPTKTSDLINDGEDGVHPFITAEDVPTPTLQSVTDEGDTTTTTVHLDGGALSNSINEQAIFQPDLISTVNLNSGSGASLDSTGKVALSPDGLVSTLFASDNITQDITLQAPNKTAGSYTLATTDDILPVTGFVPYTGATEDVDLGEFEIKAGQVEFDQTPTGTAGVGVMRWNDSDGTVDLGLKGGNVTLQVGQEQVLRVVNKTATNINLLEANYQAVRVTGAQGQRLKVDLAQATNDTLSAETIGLVTETINNNQEGFITTSGLVRGINTTGSLQGETWEDGDILYLSPTTAGNATKVKPVAPNHLIILGYVIRAHITQGSIFVKVDNGYELDELHNVKITSAANNNVLAYTSATDIWENKTVETALGYTPFQLPALTSGSVLFSNGSTIAQDNAQLFWDDTNNRLGIGTNNTGFDRLQVNGGICFGTSNNATINNGVGAGNHTYLQFSTIGNNVMRVNSTGNVLIGTTTDAGYKLNVNGTARINTLTIGLGLGQVATNTVIGVSAGGSNTTGSANFFGGYNAGFNNLGGARNTAVGNLALYSNQTGNNNNAFGDYSFASLNTGSNNAAYGQFSGRWIANGSTPLTNTNNSVFIGVDSRANANNQTNQIVIGHNAIGIGSNSVVLGNDSITTTALKGNVGIGTSTPSDKLSISAGNILIDNARRLKWADGSFIEGAGASSIMTFRSLGNYYFNGGNVGVGLASPSASLHISGASSANLLRIDSPASSSILFVSGSGNVGIGTASPLYPLHVNGVTGLRIDTSGTTALFINNTSGLIRWSNGSYFSNAGMYSGANNQIYQTFDGANVLTRLSIKANTGNVGINTTTDAGFRLDVNGTARVQGKITQTPHTNINGNISAVGALNISLNGTISAGNGSFTVFGTSNASSNYVIGYLSSSATFNNTIIIGESITVTGGQGVSIGNGSKSGFSSVSIGYRAISTNNQFVSGANGNDISNVYFGSGVTRNNTNGVGSAYTINGSGAFGTDFAGGNITIAGGKGTGIGTSGDVIFSTATPTTSGTTLQTLTQRWFIKGSNGILANVSTPNASAQLQVDSTTKGFLPPRMTTTQKNAITTPAAGLVVYDTDLNQLCTYDGTWGDSPFYQQSLRGVRYFTDFDSSSSYDNFVSLVSGVAAATGRLNNNVPNQTANQIGIAQYQTGTATTGYAMHITDSSANAQQFQFGGGNWMYESYIEVSTLSDATDRFRFVSGFGNVATSGVETIGAFFTYDEGGTQNGTIASPNWQCVTVNNLVRTLTTTSIPVTTNWVKLRIIVNADATEVKFYIDGTLVATHTTNIPTFALGRRFKVKQMIAKSLGTGNRFVYCDYIFYENNLTTLR